MEITPTSQATSVASNSSSQTEEEQSGLVANSDFETFLKLLTTQLENQDPLKPLESTEFVAQLASFSAVEQQILTNTRLSEISASFNENQVSDAADWLGKRVLSPAPGQFNGEEIEVFWEASPGATRSTMDITDASGIVVATRNLSSGQTELTWDGTMDDGSIAQDGEFVFTVRQFNDEKPTETTIAKTYNEVVEIQIDNQGLNLILSNGSTARSDQVSRIGLSS